MPRFATGKNAYGISDRSGMKYRYRDLKKEWNGSLVGPDEFEAKHPQLGPFRTVADPEAIKDGYVPTKELDPLLFLTKSKASNNSPVAV